jgi:ribosome production factor 2
LIFHGDAFDKDPELQKFKSLLIDLFRGPVVPAVRLQGLENVMSFTAIETNSTKTVHMRGYKTMLKKSGTKTPRVEIEEIGPTLDLSLRRTRIGSDDLFKRAMRQPKAAKVKKVKNVSKDQFENKLGRIHLGVQDLSKLHLRKRKALKGKKIVQSEGEGEEKRQKMAEDNGVQDNGVQEMET